MFAYLIPSEVLGPNHCLCPRELWRKVDLNRESLVLHYLNTEEPNQLSRLLRTPKSGTFQFCGTHTAYKLVREKMALITLTRLIDIVLKYANKGFFKNIHKSDQVKNC